MIAASVMSASYSGLLDLRLTIYACEG